MGDLPAKLTRVRVLELDLARASREDRDAGLDVEDQQEQALRRLSEAASPYGLRVVKTQYSELPELVLFRPAPDGREVARYRYFEPDVGQPYMRSVIPADVTATEQAEIERHMEERLAPVIVAIFSFALWISLPDG